MKKQLVATEKKYLNYVFFPFCHLTSVCDNKYSIFIQGLKFMQTHLIAQLFNGIQSHLQSNKSELESKVSY